MSVQRNTHHATLPILFLSHAGTYSGAARSLWHAPGTAAGDVDKPIVAIANSFAQLVPGYAHLKDLGQLVAREIAPAHAVTKEFHTFAVDDSITMGHVVQSVVA
jgi:dihydroxy-acid dehydratase